jgi:hypothetical protein
MDDYDRRVAQLRADIKSTRLSYTHIGKHVGRSKQWVGGLVLHGKGRVIEPMWAKFEEVLGKPKHTYTATVELVRRPSSADILLSLAGGEGQEDANVDTYGAHILETWRALTPARRLMAWQCLTNLLHEQFAEDAGLPTTTPPAAPAASPPKSGR